MKKTVFLLIICNLLITGAHAQNSNDILMSVENGDLERFTRSMDAGSDVDMVLSNGYTVLNYAIVKKQADFVAYLLHRNADIEKTSGIYTPLMFGVLSEPEILHQIISKGADVNRVHFNKTAIQLAIQTGREWAIRILRDHGATVDLSGGPDGPYIFMDDISGSSVSISVTPANQLRIDTLHGQISEIIVETSRKESFKVSLGKPHNGVKSVYENPGKIFALSDIEGNYTDFVTILINNNIIDQDLEWIFEDGHLVLLGDFVDRGTLVTQVLWLIYKLEQEAMELGGRVHFILGNHEVMNMMGDVRYAHEKYHLLACQINMNIRDFYGPDSFLGSWMRTKNVVEKIGDYIFVHGGISDSLWRAGLSIPEMNHLMRQSYTQPATEWDERIPLITGEYGLLWYRGLIQGHSTYDKLDVESVDSILAFYAAKNMIIGHSVVEDITTDYDGRVIRIDVDHYDNPSSGILIKGDRIFKATKSGQKIRIENTSHANPKIDPKKQDYYP
jgi:hypothetical protein